MMRELQEPSNRTKILHDSYFCLFSYKTVHSVMPYLHVNTINLQKEVYLHNYAED